ncbi:MAG: flagellar hook-length control protein FliK [Duganella sp.]
MQTPNLQLPSLNANAVKPARTTFPAGADNDGNNAFKQTLSREMAQRQPEKTSNNANSNAQAKAPERPPASRSSAPRAAQAPAQADNARPATEQQQAERPAQASASAQPAKEAGAAAGKPDAASDAQDTERASTDSQTTEAAQASDPMAAMLALMAAFNQPAATPDSTAAAGKAGAGALSTTAAGAEPALSVAAAVQGADQALIPADGEAADSASAAAAFKALLEQSASAPSPAMTAAATTTAVAIDAASTAAAAAAAGIATATTDEQPPSTLPPATASAGKDDGELAETRQTVAAANTAPATDATQSAQDTAQQPAIGKSSPELHIKPDHAEVAKDSNAIQPTQQRQPEPSLGAAATTRAAAVASAEASQAVKDAAPATIAPTASVALETARAAATAPTDRLYSRVGTPAWDQQLGQKVIFMAAGGEQSATMELNPPDLGPLQVVLSVNKDQATAAFTSATPEVRQALENALPKLREMMSEAGIQLGSATVSAGTSEQNNGFNQAASNQGGGQRGQRGTDTSGGSDDGLVRNSAPPRRLPAGAVDTFA